MLTFKSVQTKITVAITVLILVSVGLLAFIGNYIAKSRLEEEAFAKLTAVREIKKGFIEDYFKQINNQVVTFSENTMVVEAMKTFKKSFHEATLPELDTIKTDLRGFYEQEFIPRLNSSNGKDNLIGNSFPSHDERAIAFQHAYISNNPKPIGEKDALSKSISGVSEEYDKAHEKYHPIVRDYLKRFGYYDIFLIDPETGHIVYSVYKEIDYATSLLNGPQSTTNFADVFKKAAKAETRDEVYLVDFESYNPSYTAPASFIASPIFDEDKLIGVLVFQMPIEKINGIMTGNEKWKEDGLGESGETYLVGSDKSMRSVSRFLVEDPEAYYSILEKVNYPEESINSIRSTGTSILWQQINTVASQRALKGKEGTDIVNDYRNIPVLSAYAPLEIDGLNWAILSEIDQEEAFSAIAEMRWKLSLAGLLLIIIGIAIAFIIAKSISNPVKYLTQQLQEVAKGDLSLTIDVKSKDEIGQALTACQMMLDKLNTTLAGVVKTSINLASSSQQLNSTSISLSEGAINQAASSEEVSASMEEMAANIDQNTDNARETGSIASNVSDEITQSSTAVNETAESMKTVTAKITVIDELARQTNLLALNAAVEAARAGEQGRGFSVVAAEIRKLAERCQQAAAEINEVAERSFEISQTSAALLNNLVPNIKKTSDLVQEIVTASSEQKIGANQINNALNQFSTTVQQNAANAEQMAMNSQDLNEQAERLKKAVGFFKIKK